jgi:hypothetical protein
MTDICYVVVHEVGQYDDYTMNIVTSSLDKIKADVYVMLKNAEVAEAQKLQKKINDWIAEYRATYPQPSYPQTHPVSSIPSSIKQGSPAYKILFEERNAIKEKNKTIMKFYHESQQGWIERMFDGLKSYLIYSGIDENDERLKSPTFAFNMDGVYSVTEVEMI